MVSVIIEQTNYGLVPQWFLHNKETAFPINMTDLIPFCIFYNSEVPVTATNCAKFYGTPIVWNNNDVGDSFNPQSPVYAHNFTCNWNGRPSYCTQWLVCYKSNPGPRLFCPCSGILVGTHTADFEDVILFYDDAAKTKPYGMLTLAHGLGAEAKFTENIQFNDQGNPMVWVSLGSHSHIPEPTSRCRFFITQDCVQTRDYKYIWNPTQIICAKNEWWITQTNSRWGNPNNGAWTPELFDETIYDTWVAKNQNDKTKKCIFNL